MKVILVVFGILALIALVSSQNCDLVRCMSPEVISQQCTKDQVLAEPKPEKGICCYRCVSKDDVSDEEDSQSDEDEDSNSREKRLNCQPDCRVALVKCQDPATMVCPDGQSIQPPDVKHCKCCQYCG